MGVDRQTVLQVVPEPDARWREVGHAPTVHETALAARCAELEGQVARLGKVSALALLSAGLFHELRNPLLITGSYLESMTEDLAIVARVMTAMEEGRSDDLAVLVDSYDLQEMVAKLQHSLQESRQALRQAATVIRDLRAAAGEGPADSVCDAARICSDVIRLVRPTFAPAVTLSLDAAAVDPVDMRASALHQVLVNLVINACEAAGEGGRVLVAVAPSEDGDSVTLTVSDDGPPVDPAILAHMFEPFVTTKSASGGTGMGLAISRQLVEHCGGRIEVTSEPDWTRVRVILPLARLSQIPSGEQ